VNGVNDVGPPLIRSRPFVPRRSALAHMILAPRTRFVRMSFELAYMLTHRGAVDAARLDLVVCARRRIGKACGSHA
jgi:hypothetical protein